MEDRRAIKQVFRTVRYLSMSNDAAAIATCYVFRLSRNALYKNKVLKLVILRTNITNKQRGMR